MNLMKIKFRLAMLIVGTPMFIAVVFLMLGAVMIAAYNLAYVRQPEDSI